MKFREIASRLTGFSTPVCGISWQPPKSEVDAARRVIAFLEDRRVLYVPSEMEVPAHCVRSVLKIRSFLTDEIAGLNANSDLVKSLRAMRAACRKFLNSVGPENGEIAKFGAWYGHRASWEFNGALGELRGIIGVHVARIATQYGINVEGDLERILPGPDEEDGG